jgi:predicted alpha/beta hydrolase family esterase
VLARLQQAITLFALAGALGWAWWATQAGHVAWAVWGVLAVTSGHAVVLGLEFLLLRRAHGNDPAPRASAAQLLAAWWGETLAAPTVFCWRQPFRSQRFADHLPADAEGRIGVLFIHGFVCNRGLWNPWLGRLRDQCVPFVAVNLEPVFGSIDNYIARIENAVRQLETCTGRPPVVVAHSMGGLALRRWWAEQGDHTRVHRAITIATPHHGTWLARFAMSRNARQMQQVSRWLQTLATREPVGRAQRFTCFYSHCDNIVFPASTATLLGADNRHIPGVAHVHMADRPEPWAELQRWLQSPMPQSAR